MNRKLNPAGRDAMSFDNENKLQARDTEQKQTKLKHERNRKEKNK